MAQKKEPLQVPRAHGTLKACYLLPYEDRLNQFREPDNTTHSLYLDSLVSTLISRHPAVLGLERQNGEVLVEFSSLGALFSAPQEMTLRELEAGIDEWFDSVMFITRRWIQQVEAHFHTVEQAMVEREANADILCDFGKYESCVHEEAFHALQESPGLLDLVADDYAPQESHNLAVNWLADRWTEKYDRYYGPRPGWPNLEPSEDPPSPLPDYLRVCPEPWKLPKQRKPKPARTISPTPSREG